MKKNIDFSVSIADVIRFLGEENFENKESALYELVKNAYDAKSSFVKIIFSDDKIEIIDEGIGMSAIDIEDKWMKIGYSSKREKYMEDDVILTGEKGIGRLAISRLGKQCKLYSKSKSDDGILWETDWKKNTIIPVDDISQGTKIEITNLFEKWNDNDIEKFKRYLSLVIKIDNFKIIVSMKGKEEIVRNAFLDIKPNINYFINYQFKVINNEVKIKVDNKLFSKKIVKELNLLEMYDATLNRYEGDKLKNLEGVEGQIYYGFRIDKKPKSDFQYRPEVTDYEKFKIYGENHEGVILYRNGFSINGYEGKKDWLKLGERYNRRNKAISDEKGPSAFRKENIFGYINIDKIKNKNLRDLSNRQGLIENDDFELLVKVVHEVFTKVENHVKYDNILPIAKKVKQEKERVIEKNKGVEKKLNKAVEDFKKKKLEEKVELLNTGEEKYFAFKRIEDLETQRDIFKEDAYFLQTYATQSLLINSITHDLKNQLSVIRYNPEYIEIILKNKKLNDKLIEETKNENKSKNYCKLMKELKEDGLKLNILLLRHLNGIKKEKLEKSKINMVSYIQEIQEYYQNINTGLNINFTTNCDTIEFYETTLDIIFNNLIDNTQKNNLNDKCNIKIEFMRKDKEIIISYEDDGVGLNESYVNKEEEILRLGETTNSKSSGLGMWIIDQRVKIYNGEIEIRNASISGFGIVIKMNLEI